MKEDSDEALLARYRAGHMAAFNALYQRHEVALYRYVLRMVQQAHLANDLFQEVWLSVIKTPPGFDDGQSFAAWLYTVARNRVIDHLRLARNVVMQVPDAELQADGSDADSPDFLSGVADPADDLHHRRMAEAFIRCVDELPVLQREAFVLQAETGMSIEEIAAMTQAQVETVKSRLRYARNTIRKQMEAWR